jgi:hypothetical protein
MPPRTCRAIETLRGAYGMNRTFKAAVAALIFAVGFAGSVAAGPFEAAVATLGSHAMQGLQGDLSTFVVIIAAAAFLPPVP